LIVSVRMRIDQGYLLSQTGKSDVLDALINQQLGQFRIVERIGVGGMAMVYKAYQPNLDRYVAIKILPASQSQDPVFVKRFVQEARSVAKLAHPNIVQIHDFGTDPHYNVTYIVMEYVDGGTLKDRLDGPMLATEAVDFIIQAAEGLGCAHRNGIIHRDVKPANMLLRQGNHLLLSDFGIAKILEESSSLTRVGTGIGTPQYMSPEQGMGQPVDRRSDIYSLGIVLFHCLCGSVPFAADNPLTVTVKHINEPLPVGRLTAAGVPDALVQVVLKMSAKQVNERYQSAEEVVAALTDALAAANLSMPRVYRAGIPPLPSGQGSSKQLAGNGIVTPAFSGSLLQTSQPNYPGYAQANTPPSGGVVCFRCGAVHPSSRRFCTTCGDDLSNARASRDTYIVNGRPVLARLMIQSGPLSGRAYRFHQDVSTVGRTSGNDLILADPSVSRRHARLWCTEGYWYLEDIGSSNGTLVNNTRIFQAVVLNDGDIINFGDEVAVFNIVYGP
jgi:Serine/threonine protein kinase